MSRQGFIAFDLGAESGRAMLAILDGDRIQLDEQHRFANQPVHLPSGFHWNTTGLFASLIEGLGACVAAARRAQVPIVSLGVDTWGVDFGFIGRSGQLLGLPFIYRDPSHEPAMQRCFNRIGRKAIYDATGIQLLPINSLYQLVDRYEKEPALIDSAQRLLNMPDLLHYLLSGEMVNEATIASTTQMVDPRTGQWATGLLGKLDLPTHMLGDITPAGERIGTLRPELAQATGGEGIDIILPGSHDTASAVAAIPVADEDIDRWAYLSSGTWSLMGAEIESPIISDEAREAGFTNERGVGGRIRLLRNLAGLWLVQQVRQDLIRKGREYDYEQLTRLAAEAEPFRTLLDVGHGPFALPGDMLAKTDDFADTTGQPRPTSPGQYVRACLESLALAYRQTLEQLQKLTGQDVAVLHLVGGGGRNQLLNQMTADAIRRPVAVGPYEGTAMGNALVQAMGAGHVRDLSHLRTIVRASSELSRIEPSEPAAFDAQYDRFCQLAGAGAQA